MRAGRLQLSFKLCMNRARGVARLMRPEEPGHSEKALDTAAVGRGPAQTASKRGARAWSWVFLVGASQKSSSKGRPAKPRRRPNHGVCAKRGGDHHLVRLGCPGGATTRGRSVCVGLGLGATPSESRRKAAGSRRQRQLCVSKQRWVRQGEAHVTCQAKVMSSSDRSTSRPRHCEASPIGTARIARKMQADLENGRHRRRPSTACKR